MRAVLALDIDYTISPSKISGPKRQCSSPYQGTHFIPERVFEWMNRYEVVWLTNWGWEATDIADLPVLDGPPGGWWKANAMSKFIMDNPDVTHVIWCDDELDEHSDWTAPRPSVKVKMIIPKMAQGLTDHDDAFIEHLFNTAKDN